VKGNWKRAVCLILVLAMTLAMPTPAVSQAAKKKAPKLNKSKLNLTVGKTAALKVKNTKKKIKWSSSKKSVATVTQKGKVKAKKAGKTTITAKIGKKKLKCKVTVTAKKSNDKQTPTPAPTVKPTVKPTEKPDNSNQGNTTGNNPTPQPLAEGIISSLTFEDAETLVVTLKTAQELTKENFVVKIKKYTNGSYNRQLKIEEVSTQNNITYRITLASNTEIGQYTLVTITDAKGMVSNKEAVLTKEDDTVTETRLTYTTSNEISKNIYLEGYGYHKIVSVDLPKGLSYEKKTDSWGDSYLKISGTPEETGVQKKDIVYVDEFGNSYTNKITWMIANEDTIVAYCDPSYHAYTTGKVNASNNFYVTGGSGSYTYNVLDSDATISTSSSTTKLNKSFTETGTYEMNIEVVDENNAELKTTFTWVANVAQARKVTIKVLDAKGESIEKEYRYVYATAQDKESPYTQSVSNSVYSSETMAIWVVDGIWDFRVEVDGYECEFKNYEVKGEDITLDLQTPFYKVTLPDIGVDFDDTNWYEGELLRGEDSSFYAPVGTISYTTSIQDKINLALYDLTCNVSAEAEENVATISVVMEGEAVYGAIDLVTSKTVEVQYPYYKFFTFVPTETGTYKFYSEKASTAYVDTYGILYDGALGRLATNDDGNKNGQFAITQKCNAGETYYIGIRAYSMNYKGGSSIVKVEKVEETAE